MTGMRRGEVLGLRWSDVDLESARLSVQQALVTVGYD
jgi:integrase